MSNLNLRNLTNSFQDVRLLSLASWRGATEFQPRDRGGPYVVLQEGYDPEDLKMIAEEYVFGRSGKWLSLGLFYRLPVPERRAEFIFGTAAEVMKVMADLPPKAQILRPKGAESPSQEAPPEADEMRAALQAARGTPPSAPG